jgi:formylmethanofuran dehydrogenase subunit E
MALRQELRYPAEVDPVVRFHGHFCPGVSIGVRAAQIALREIGSHSKDEEVVAIVETDMCAVDAIQQMVGCTFGKGNFFHLDYGKNAYTFIRRSDGKAIRVVGKPNPFGKDPEREALMAKMDAGEATPEDRKRFQELQWQRGLEILDAPEEELFTVTPVEPAMPTHARLRASVECDICGEPTMETRTRRIKGQIACIPCFERLDRRFQ